MCILNLATHEIEFKSDRVEYLSFLWIEVGIEYRGGLLFRPKERERSVGRNCRVIVIVIVVEHLVEVRFEHSMARGSRAC